MNRGGRDRESLHADSAAGVRALEDLVGRCRYEARVEPAIRFRITQGKFVETTGYGYRLVGKGNRHPVGHG